MKNLSPSSTRKTNEVPAKQTTTKVEPLQLNVTNDQQQPYRANDMRRDEAVNTIDSTFRR